ncbi:hypothetical protein OOK06_06115 [Streptomyces sp. NBC_00340]|nr:hypothetical protein [Streptomyces sp. SID14446]MCX5131677.1 hypothetical protein [Streptomyces sp. NBC_00340]NEB28155.1 hypothetical protein [Streptomyces sp. SID14446]
MWLLSAVGLLGSGAVLVGGAGAVGGPGGLGGAVTPEADLAYHGTASMASGLVDVRLTPRNHGPDPVDDATVRLRWSAALGDAQVLPVGCARSGERVVVCRTGALPADGPGEEIRMTVRLREVASEVTVGLDTVWGGGSVDRNHANDRQQVLVLDTGDAYAF